jgi:hypothetical protein
MSSCKTISTTYLRFTGREIAFKCMTTQGAPLEPVFTVDFYYKQGTPLGSKSPNFIVY